MQGIVICLLILLVADYSVGQGTNQPYQPECDSWDQVVSAIRASATSQGASVGDCDKLDDCTGMKCIVTALGKRIEIDVKLFHCDDPPQMRILLVGSGISFEETITHGSSYTIPGLSYSTFPFLPTLNIEMVVQFEKQPDGIVIGAKLRTVGAPIEFPLFSDILIRTPVCPTANPLVMDCIAMEELVNSIVPPPSCSKKTTCDGISCSQRYTFSSGSLPAVIIDVTSDLTVDSCSTPISLILKADSAVLNLDWTHTFRHSDSVPVDQDLTFGASLVVNVTMVPLSDLEHIQTTIKYTITQAAFGSSTESVLTNALVPIPECRDVPPTDLTPTPSDECASWKNIENALEFSFGEGYSVSDCVTLPGCRGFNCSATYDSDIYYVVIEEFHCQDPTYITVSIDGDNEHYSQNFTHNETVPIPDANGVQLLVHLVKESPTVIFVGVYILYPVPGGEIITFPLVSDQLLQVTPCEAGTSTVAMETVMRESPGGGYSHSSTSRPSGVTAQSTTIKNDQGKPTKFSSNKDNKPFQEPVSSNGSIGLAWNLVLAIITAVVLAVVASAIFVFFRRRRQSRDLDMLMENTDATHRDSFTPNWNA